MTMSLPEEVRALCLAASKVRAPAVRVQLPHLDVTLASDDTDCLAQVQRALLNQAATATMGSMRVLVCDRQSHPDLIPPSFAVERHGLGAYISALEAAGLYGSYDSDYGSLQLLDPSCGAGVQLLPARGAVPPWERAFPLRNFLHWGAVCQGQRLLHAGTLGLRGRGVLLAGAGGAGKSGTVLAGLCHGLRSVGDDYILLDPALDGIFAQPVMRLMKQDQTGLARLGLAGEMDRFGARNWQNKFEFDFEELFPGSRATRLKIGAVFLPKIGTEARSSLRPASTREVMFALLPNNLQQLPGAAQQAMAVIARIARDLPGYHLSLSSDPAEIAASIRAFLEGGWHATDCVDAGL